MPAPHPVIPTQPVAAAPPEDPHQGALSPDDAAFLHDVGDRLRLVRARRGMTRKILSRASGVSERYLAQLESGQGNISIRLLRAVARALSVPMAELLAENPERRIEQVMLEQFLSRLSETELAEARDLLHQRFGHDTGKRRDRIALIGLRGAGKSTLGRLLAERRSLPFHELDREIETEAGIDLAEVFEVYGQEGFRRLERSVLERLVGSNQPMVLATGGSLVTEPATYELLLRSCLTVWLRAEPEDHMARVVAQGDLRPIEDKRRAMDDLRSILAARSLLYAKADITLVTSHRSLAEAADDLDQATG